MEVWHLTGLTWSSSIYVCWYTLFHLKKSYKNGMLTFFFILSGMLEGFVTVISDDKFYDRFYNDFSNEHV
jgi:hypothetical protein